MITRREILKKAAIAAPTLALGGALSQAASAAGASSPAAGKNLFIFITHQEREIQHFPKG